MSGTVNIARAIFSHEFFAEETFTEREAWIWLIMEASWKPRKKRAGDFVVDLGRGQLAASIRFMAEAWGWAPARVQRFIKRLQKLDMITSKTDTGVSVITICNYGEYQGGAKGADTAAIQDRYRSDTNEKKDERRETTEIGKPISAADGFEQFWSAAPRKVAKLSAMKAYRAALKRADAKTLLDGMIRYAESRRGQDPQFTVHPATWLNSGRWTDDASPRANTKPSDTQFGAFGTIRSVG